MTPVPPPPLPPPPGRKPWPLWKLLLVILGLGLAGTAALLAIAIGGCLLLINSMGH